MVILIIDNYDSFTYNIVQYVGDLGFISKVVRNDFFTIKQVKKLSPSHIIISPGPGLPHTAGISLHIIKHFAENIPILGVCLGHQSIGLIYGANIIHSSWPVHGKTSLIYHNRQGLFSNINKPEQLKITAWTDNGIIMACEHKVYPLLKGIQFHPESLWTTQGKKILQNFLS